MRFVAFYPECYSAPAELLSAMVPAGTVTEKIWKEALSDRIIDLALQEPDPSASTSWACRALACPHTDEAGAIAEYLFESNYEFKTFINLSIIDIDPNEYFPIEVFEDNEGALEAVNNTTLFDWVLNVAYFIGGDTLNTFLTYEHRYPGT